MELPTGFCLGIGIAMLNHLDAALAAPEDPGTVQVQSAVIMAASILSVFGAGWIMTSFVVCASRCSESTYLPSPNHVPVSRHSPIFAPSAIS